MEKRLKIIALVCIDSLFNISAHKGITRRKYMGKQINYYMGYQIAVNIIFTILQSAILVVAVKYIITNICL